MFVVMLLTSSSFLVQTPRLTTISALQAFRHLYVLAAQPRSVDAIDVDSKQACLSPAVAQLACCWFAVWCCLQMPLVPNRAGQLSRISLPPCCVPQPVYVPLQIELGGTAVPALGDGQHVGSVLRPVASVSKVGLGSSAWVGRSAT